MALAVEDLINLRQGTAPADLELVQAMTLGQAAWLDRFIPYYLDEFIPAGGSKVKLLVGSEGSGKTHLLRYIQAQALQKDYTVVFLSARTAGAKLNDVPNLYRLISESLAKNQLIQGLARKVAEELGYGPQIYNGQSKLLPYVMQEGYGAPDAAREIRIAAARLLKNADLSPSFFTCAFTLLKDHLISEDHPGRALALKWLDAEKLTTQERRESGLFEILRKPTARRWLDSLLKLIVLSGQQGLVMLIDDLDVLYERSAETGRFIYTPANIKDTYELFRQLIDDADLLHNFLLLLSGRRTLLEDDRRGFKSYEALWMRLQTGLVPSGQFNPLCDIVDVDLHLAAQGSDFPLLLSRHLDSIFARYSLKKKPFDLANGAGLKSVVVGTVYAGDEAEVTHA